MTQQLPLWSRRTGTVTTSVSVWNEKSAPAAAVPALPRVREKADEWYPTIRDLPESERPANRLHFYGPAALATSELLAILLGNSYQLRDASALMAGFESLTGIARASANELQTQPGIGAVTVARIKAAFELGQRLITEPAKDLCQIRQPADAANLVMTEMSLLDQEHLRTMLLDTRNRVLGIPTIYIGSVNTTLIRVAEVFREAIRRQCPSLIVLHNHPSGDPAPSPEDVAITKSIVEVGKLLDIDVMDHLIIGHQRFVSLKERGLGFD